MKTPAREASRAATDDDGAQLPPCLLRRDKPPRAAASHREQLAEKGGRPCLVLMPDCDGRPLPHDRMLA